MPGAVLPPSALQDTGATSQVPCFWGWAELTVAAAAAASEALAAVAAAEGGDGGGVGGLERLAGDAAGGVPWDEAWDEVEGPGDSPLFTGMWPDPSLAGGPASQTPCYGFASR